MTAAMVLRKARDRLAYALDPRVDRYVLEHVVMRALEQAPGQPPAATLFVGCDWYTRRYHGDYPGLDLRTIDIDPAKARYGTPDHIVGSITTLDVFLPPRTMDAVVLNGVVGFGLNDPASCEKAIRQCHAVLRPGGWLVIGWNDVDDLRPVTIESIDALRSFEAEPLPPFPGPRYPTFSPARHTFDFYRRASDG